MSHIRVKTKYNTEGSWGSVDEHTMYAHHNLSCDIVCFYDEEGNLLLAVNDTIKNNMIDAINKLYFPHKDHGVLEDGVEYYTTEEFDEFKDYKK